MPPFVMGNLKLFYITRVQKLFGKFYIFFLNRQQIDKGGGFFSKAVTAFKSLRYRISDDIQFPPRGL